MRKPRGPGGGVRAGALGISDQVLLSAANLAVGLALARELEPAAFGIYVIAFAISLAGASVQLSLVTDPLMVLGSPRSGEDQSRWFAALLRVQLCVSVVVAATVGLVAAALHAAWDGEGAVSQLPLALAAVGLATLPTQMHTFFRAVFFARLRPAAVFWNDLLYSTLRLAGLGGLIVAGGLSPFAAIMVGGAAALVAVAAALPFCRDLLAARAGSVREAWRAHWRYGRWLLATSGAYWCSGQAPALITGGLLTPAAAAVLKACQYLVAPLNVTFNGLDGVLAPRASKVRATQGEPALARFLRLVAVASGAGVALYALAMLPFAPWIMDVVYKGRYAGYTPIVAMMLLDALLAALGRAPILRLKLMGDTRAIFVGYLWAAMIGLSCLALAAPVYGVFGAAAAAPVASGTLLAYLTLTSRTRSSRTTPVTGPVTAAVSEP